MQLSPQLLTGRIWPAYNRQNFRAGTAKPGRRWPAIGPAVASNSAARGQQLGIPRRSLIYYRGGISYAALAA